MRWSIVILAIVSFCSMVPFAEVVDSYRSTGRIRYGKVVETVAAAGSIYAVARFAERRMRR